MLKSIIIGILAGYIASRIQKGKSSGCLGNLFLGIIGGIVGHLLFSFANFSIDNTFGELVSSVVVLLRYCGFSLRADNQCVH